MSILKCTRIVQVTKNEIPKMYKLDFEWKSLEDLLLAASKYDTIKFGLAIRGNGKLPESVVNYKIQRGLENL
mgnify:CR=1 FL=1